MITVHRKVLEEIITDLINTNDIRMLVQKYSYEKVFYYYLFKDIAKGSNSSNYKIFHKVAKKRRVSEGFLIDQANLILRYLSPYDQPDLVEYYKTLGVTKDSTEEQIRSKWLELMKTHHPDKVGDDELETAKKINEAYEALRNSQKHLEFQSMHLPDIPIIVTEGSLQKNLTYAIPIVLVVIVAFIYLSNSRTMFNSGNENEEIAALVETTSPNLTDSNEQILQNTEKDLQVKQREITKITSDPIAVSKKQIQVEQKEIDKVPEQKTPEIVAEAKKNAIDPSKTFAELREQGDLAAFLKAENIEIVAQAEKNVIDPSETFAELREQGDLATFLKVENNLDTENIAQKLEAAQKSEEIQITSSKIIGSEKTVDLVSSENTDADIKDEGESGPVQDAAEEKVAKIDVLNEYLEDRAVTEAEEFDIDESQSSPVSKESDEENEKSSSQEKILYVVKSGDSLWTIAKKFNTTSEELMEFNTLPSNKLDIGDELFIPAERAEFQDSAQKPSQELRAAKIKKDQNDQIAALDEKTKDKKTAGTPGDSPPDQKNKESASVIHENEYVVKSGDSVWTISRKFKITAEELLAFNNLSDDKLDIGDKLFIPTNEDRVIISKSDPPQSKKITKDNADKIDSNKGKEPASTQSSLEQTDKSTDKKVAGKLKEQPTQETPTNVKKPKELKKESKTESDKPIIAKTSEDIKTKNPEPLISGDKASLRTFVYDYVTAYKNRNLTRIKSLFAADALENGVEVSKVIRKYEENFSSVDLKKYEMNVRNIELDGPNGLVTGDFNITYAAHGKSDVKSSRGSITWSVDWNNKGWEIKELNYKIVSTD